MLDIKEYLKQTKTVLLTQDAFDELMQRAFAQPEHTNSWCINSWCIGCKEYDTEKHSCPRFNRVIKQTLDDAYRHGETEAEAMFHAQQRWIPCSERLPEDIRPVIVTWKNTDPASYYQYIVGKHFTGTACYKNGKWYWYSSTTEDMLSEYGRYDSEEFDEAIECIAWMPLPEPYAERRTDG